MTRAVVILLVGAMTLGCASTPPELSKPTPAPQKLAQPFVEGQLSARDIIEFRADPIPEHSHFPEYRIDLAIMDEVLSKWYQVTEHQWMHNYSHIAGEDRTGTMKLSSGSIVRWMVKPGGLAILTYPDNSSVHLAQSTWPPRE